MYSRPGYDRMNRPLEIGDLVVIRSEGNHHDGLMGFYIGNGAYSTATVWHPHQMWRTAKPGINWKTKEACERLPIVNDGQPTGWEFDSLEYVASGSFCSECEEWFIGWHEYLCPSCRP